jgi:hypothetical protein
VPTLATVLTALAFVLTVLGGLLPVGAIFWARTVTRREFRALDSDLTRLQAIAEAHPVPSESTPLMYAVRQPSANMTTATYVTEEVQRAILASALKDLRGPAVLAGVGALAGMAGSLLAL